MATISFSTIFNLVPTLPVGNFTDTSNYAGQGITTTNVNGCFKVVSPSGVTVYENTDYSDANCDIKVSTSTSNQTTIYLPYAALIVELGTYTITYTVKDITAAPVYYTVTNSYDNEYTKPVIEITPDVNCIAQIFGQTDATNYVVNGITPTITKVNKLIYPAGIKGGAPTPLTTTADTLRTAVFFNGTQTSTVTSSVSYAFTDGLTVVDSLFGSLETLVDCSYYCSIACGVKAYANTMNNFRLNGNITDYNKYKDNFELVTSYITLIRLLIECNGGGDISRYLNLINDIIGDCNCGCDDDDDQFSRVTGWGSLVGADGTNGINGTNGADGANGANGANGVSVLYNNFAGTSHTGAFTTLNSYLLPANTLTQSGDMISIDGSITQALVTGKSGNLKLEIGGADAMPSVLSIGYLPVVAQGVYTTFNAKVTRLTATTIAVKYSVAVNYPPPFVAGVLEFFESTITVNNLTSLTNLIDLQGSTTGANTLTCNEMTVIYLKKS